MKKLFIMMMILGSFVVYTQDGSIVEEGDGGTDNCFAVNDQMPMEGDKRTVDGKEQTFKNGVWSY